MNQIRKKRFHTERICRFENPAPQQATNWSGVCPFLVFKGRRHTQRAFQMLRPLLRTTVVYVFWLLNKEQQGIYLWDVAEGDPCGGPAAFQIVDRVSLKHVVGTRRICSGGSFQTSYVPRFDGARPWIALIDSEGVQTQAHAPRGFYLAQVLFCLWHFARSSFMC